MTASLLEQICVVWWLAAATVHVATASLALLQPWVRHRRLTPPVTRPVSIIIPIKHEEEGFADAQASVLAQMRPGDELFIAAAETDSVALQQARAVLQRYPAATSHVVTADVRIAVSPKLNNLVTPMARAAHDIIFVKDSNVVLADGQLQMLLRHLAPGVGLVTVATQADEAKNLPARIEAAFMNGYQGRLVLAASALGLGFGLGKVLLFSRDAFTQAGGVSAIANTVAEDQALTKLFARRGRSTVIAGDVVRQLLGRRALRTVWQRQLRWMICRRFDEKPAFIAEPCFAGLCAVLVAYFAAPYFGLAPSMLAGLTAIGWYGVENAFLALKKWPLVTPLAWLCREWLIVALWLRAWSTRNVVWAGARMDVRGADRAAGITS